MWHHAPTATGARDIENPSMMSRRSYFAGRPPGLSGGIKWAMLDHCRSVNSLGYGFLLLHPCYAHLPCRQRLFQQALTNAIEVYGDSMIVFTRIKYCETPVSGTFPVLDMIDCRKIKSMLPLAMTCFPFS